MTSFTQVFGGATIYPSDISYSAVALDRDVVLEWPLDAASGSDLAASIIDITTSGVHSLVLPDAMLASNGATILFNNLGPDAANVVDATGGALLSLSPGEVWQAYLTDNSSEAGSWNIFQYGATTAQAQASALAGAGLVAIGSVLAQSIDVATINAGPYNFLTTERAQAFIWVGALGAFTLPSASDAGNNWFINVRNGGTGQLTISPAGSEPINGEPALSMAPGDSAVIVTNGLEWWTIGLGQRAVFAFDYTAISLAGLSGTYTLAGAELNRIAYNFTGALSGNITVIVPATVQQYWVTNSATGFTLSLQAAGGSSPVNIASGDKSIFYCNGSEIVLAVTTSGIPTPISIADGGTNATSASGARAQLGAAASGANSDITGLTGLGAGTVSAPIISPAGDGNTGIYFPSADTVSLAVGGVRSFFTEWNGSGNANVIFGQGAAAVMGVGTASVAIGAAAMGAATGIRNTVVGTSAAGNLTTGTNNTCIGYAAAPAAASASNSVTLGNTSVTVLRCAVTTITASSDARDKADIKPLAVDLEFLNTLRPVSFTWNRRDGGKVGVPDIGFIAQELLGAMDECNVSVPGLVDQTDPEHLEAGYGALIPVIVRSVQQLSDLLDCERAARQQAEVRIAALEAASG